MILSYLRPLKMLRNEKSLFNNRYVMTAKFVNKRKKLTPDRTLNRDLRFGVVDYIAIRILLIHI